jgi:ribonuclease Y
MLSEIPIELLIIGGTISLLSGLLGLSIGKRLSKNSSHIYIKQAKAKAKSIEKEAEYILKDAKIRAKEYELKHKRSVEESTINLQAELKERERRLKRDNKDLDRERGFINKLKREYQNKLDEAFRVLEKGAGLTKSEAKEVLINKIEEESKSEMAHIIRKHETEAKEIAEKKANYIIAQATTRFAGEFSAERLVNTIKLQSDDIKGRIIGKEGRNIKRLEQILGVDIIVDGTPRTITLSSFNLYRRAIAVKTLEKLIDDGRIQPARIEEIYEKVQQEFQRDIEKEGENVLMELGITNMHSDLVKLIGKLKFRASYGQNALAHSVEVAYLAGIMTVEMGGDETLARRAGLLHDIGKALTHENGGNHVDLGATICKKYGEDEVVINAIYAHHEYEEAKTIEVAAVCTADKLSAGRPGARREVLENSLKRVKQIEEIALTHQGIKNAYAVNSGRELRVIVNSVTVNDEEASLLSKQIAKEIEEKVEKFPGEIVVNVIRESRSQSVAKSLY